MTSNGPPMLPPELHDQIIDHLHDDLAALASCALVCRTWLQCSHYHLSYQCKIYERNARNLSFLLISRDSTCTITNDRAACHLRIEGRERFLVGHNFGFVRERAASIRLRQLTIIDLDWIKLSSSAVEDLLSFRMIRELHLYNNHFNDEIFVRLLLAFPYLRSLKIDGFRDFLPTQDIIYGRPVMPNLQVLQFAGGHLPKRLLHLSPSPNSNIRDISLQCLRSSDIPRVCEFLKTLGTRVENLKLGLRGTGKGSHELSVLERYVKLGAFDTLTGLRSFQMDLASRPFLRFPSSWFLGVVVVFLEHLNSPTLEHLQFLFWVDEDSLDLPLHVLACFTNAMARPSFSCLKTLLFEIEGASDDRKCVIEGIRCLLSVYEERGILKFKELNQSSL